MEALEPYLNMIILGNPLLAYLKALGIAIAIYVVFRFVLYIGLKRIEKIAKKTKTKLDDATVQLAEKLTWPTFWLILISVINFSIQLPPLANSWVDGAFNIVLVYFGIKFINYWIRYAAHEIISKKADDAERITIEFVTSIIRILVWVFGFVFLLSSFGYNISSLVAGLGIGGIAIALALQNMLGDLISCVSIYVDKPFKVGHYIQVGQQQGTVKRIGLKTTRMTSINGEEIVMSNKYLTETQINNFGKLRQRRVMLTLGVTYDTKAKKMEQIPGWLKEIVEKTPDTTFSRAHFTKFGDFSKNFELVFFVDSKDYITSVDRLQQVNFEIQKLFEKKKIGFAFPTQTIHLQK